MLVVALAGAVLTGAVLTGCGDVDSLNVTQCTRGTLDCLCAADDTCSAHDGVELRCVDDRCVMPECPPGQADCSCLPDDTCSALSPAGPLVCAEGRCVVDACPVGTAGCDCAWGASCAAGLVCQDVDGAPTCRVRNACPVGTQGCPCHLDERCEPENPDGEPLVCAAGSCVPDGCQRGEQDCGCLPGGRCADGSVCVGLFCVADTGQTRVPPENPRCYTPCRDSIRGPDGQIERLCDSDGIMEGCVGRALCVDGSCVEVEYGVPKAAAGCQNDAECNTLQTCITAPGEMFGQCYSDCEVDADCNGERVCHLKVCRLPCDTQGAECADGGWCQLEADGATGHCFAHSAGVTAVQSAQTAGAPTYAMWRADLDPPSDGGASGALALGLTDEAPCYGVRFQNPSDVPIALRVRRVRHEVRSPDQILVVDADESALDDPDNPALPWLAVGEGSAGGCAAIGEGTPAADDPTFVLSPGAEHTIYVANGPHPVYDRYEGRFAVDAQHADAYQAGEPAFRRHLDVTWSRGPIGHWAGDMVIFADFDTTDLEAWLAADRPDGDFDDGANPPESKALNNALIGRWLALREGRLSFPEFLASLRAMRDGTWNLPAVRALCPDGALCYLADNPVGYGILADDETQGSVPGAVGRIPFAIDLARAELHDGAPMAWGRVPTASVLQYPGDPRVEVAFGEQIDLGGRSLVQLDTLGATVRVGGQRPLSNGPCPINLEAGYGFAVDEVPWLVPGFTAGTTPAAREGERVRQRCLDIVQPFSGGGREDDNKSLARANPVPTGQVMQRHIELIDGAMIDAQTIFAIVRETIDPPPPMAGDTALSAYGYVLLERDPQVVDLQEGPAPNPQVLPALDPAPGVACDQTLVASLLGQVRLVDGGVYNEAVANRLAAAVVDGVVPVDFDALVPLSETFEEPHALCVHTDDIDGGLDGPPCPADSPVVFFTTAGEIDLSGDSCHQAVPACMASEDCPDCTPSTACGECADGTACLLDGCLAALNRGDIAVERWHPATKFTGDAADIVIPGEQGRCGEDPDLRSCHAFYAAEGDAPVGLPTGLQVGYLCHATGRLRDPSIHVDPSGGDPLEDDTYCPLGSEVTYFFFDPVDPVDPVDPGGDDAGGFHLPEDHPCNDAPGFCRDGEPCSRFVCVDNGAVHNDVANGEDPDCSRLCVIGDSCRSKGSCIDQPGTDLYPTARLQWTCEDPLRGTCSDDRYDLTAGKRFFLTSDVDASLRVAEPLDQAIESAFRYETRFRNRQGTSLGFTPAVCDAASGAQSYCYDPAAIIEVEKRVDCAVALYTDGYDELLDEARQTLQAFLTRAFSMREEFVPGLAAPITHDGFERARAKLLVMLGDEAFTQALSSRFDRAGIRQATFRGQEFEAGGIELTGIAGYEMFSLHLAVQYFDLALERAFHLGPAVRASLFELPAGAGFITAGTANAWFERLLRASVRKAAAQAEIAERYRVMAMPALGRRVVERAAAGVHLESVLFSRLMIDLVGAVDAAARPQLRRALDRAQTGWAAAQRQLAATYALLDDTPRFLGIPEGFVPFPPVDRRFTDVNAFETLLAAARRKVAIAADKEVQAIDDSRAFDTSEAEFRSTLAALRVDYEQRIGALCGTFGADDGAIYPAIARYAHLDPRARQLDDPCGRMGNGAIADALSGGELHRLKLEEAKQQQLNLYGTMDGLNTTMTLQCERIVDLALLTYETQGEIIELRETIAGLDILIEGTDRMLGMYETLFGAIGCEPPTVGLSNSPGTCIGEAIEAGLMIAAQAAATAVVLSTKGAQLALNTDIGQLEAALALQTQLDECTALQIDTHGQITGLFAEIPVLANRVQQQLLQIQGALAEVESRYNEAKALQAAYAEAEALAIDVEAARNDPNVRIYRSDAVLAADRTFTAALEEVYETTLVFEYYTGQSYAERDRLRFVRLAYHGEDNLERYLAELADAFDDFEQVYGNPDIRVTIVSLRDVLAPALVDGAGVPLTTQQRTDAFREALKEAGRVDPQGRHRVDFRLAFDRLSPLTLGHKVRAVEAELVGEGLGDALARVYLTPIGTATVRGVDEDRQYRLPPRTAVLDTFFNGDRDARLDPVIYRSERLRDQPLVNTEWEVVFDDEAEQVNADVEIDALEDIRFYIYYADFTEAP